jgi:Flp pilus assembly protein TadD
MKSDMWGPAVAILAAGLLVGLVLVARLRRSKRGEADAGLPLELRDLDGRIEALLRQLQDLEDASVKRTPEQLVEERYALELQAAQALLARERVTSARKEPRRKATAAEAVRAEQLAAGRGRRRAFLWVAALAAAGAAIVGLAWRAAQPRPEGGSVTGSVGGGAQGSAQGSAQDSAAGQDERSGGAEADLRAAVGRNPDDLEARLNLARQLLRNRDLMGVFNETQYVLSRSPGHPRALTYQALVRLAMGQGDVAVAMLRRAVAADPDLLEARRNLVFAYAKLGRLQEAEAAIAETSQRFPAEGARLKQALSKFAEQTGPESAAPAR